MKKIELNDKQLKILRDAGVVVPPDASDDSFLTAEDEELLGDYHVNCLDENQDMTAKAEEVLELLNYLAEF